MGTNQRFNPLQKKEALRIVAEHFGIINESTLDDIERAIGRRPTRQGVQRWLPDRQEKRQKVEVPDPPEGGQKFVTSANNLQQVQQVQQALDEIVQAAPDDRTIGQKLDAVINSLIRLSDQDFTRINPEKRLRLLPPLLEAWQKLNGLEPEILKLAPYIKRLVEQCEAKNIDVGYLLEDLITVVGEQRPDMLTEQVEAA